MAAYKPEHWHLSLYKTYLQNNDSTHVFKVQDLNDAVFYIVQWERKSEIQDGVL